MVTIPKITRSAPNKDLVTVKDIFNAGERKWWNAWTLFHPEIPLEYQVRFYIEGHKKPFHMDFLEPKSKLVIEISGGSHVWNLRRDYERTRWLHDHDYLVYTFTPADLTLRDRERHCEQVYRAILRRIP